MFVPDNNPELPMDEETITKKEKKDEDFHPNVHSQRETELETETKSVNSKY